MGLDAAGCVYEHFRSIAPGAFVFVSSTREDHEKLLGEASYAGCVRVRDRLPDNVRFDAVLVDLSSLLMSMTAYTNTGADLMERVERLLSTSHAESGTQDFVLCFDNKEFVPRVKSIEQAERRQRTNAQPYVYEVQLTTNASLPIEQYVFDDAMPMPNDFNRLHRTPVLVRKLETFIAAGIVSRMRPPPVPMRVVVCGVPQPDPDAPRMVWSRRFVPDDFTPQTVEKQAVAIGEAESRCAYWLIEYLRAAKSNKSVCVRANDSDTLMLLLMCVPRMLAATADGLQHQLWLEYTAPNMQHRRFVNVLWLWRAQMRWTQLKLPSISLTRHAPVETFYAALLMAGCDYVRSLRGIGPKTFYDAYVDRMDQLVGAIEFDSRSDVHAMVFQQGPLLDLLWRAVCRSRGMTSLFVDYGRQMSREKGRQKPDVFAKQAIRILEGKGVLGRFDELSMAVAKTNDVRAKANKEEERLAMAQARKPRKKAFLPEVPDGEAAVAFVRRVLWTVDYYHNAGVARRSPPYWQPGDVTLFGYSVYGFLPAPDGSNAVIEAGVVADVDLLEHPFVDRMKQSLHRQRPAAGLTQSMEVLSPNSLARERQRLRELRESQGVDEHNDFFDNDLAHELDAVGIDQHATLLAVGQV